LGLVTSVFFILYETLEIIEYTKSEERKKIELWAMAQKNFIESKNLDDDIGELSIFLLTKSFENPIIQVDENEKIIAHKNIFKEYQTDIDSLKLKSFLKKISIENRPISITFNNSINQKLYYGNSDLFNKIKYFPFALVLVAVFFTLIVFNYFKSSFNSNKNKVWASFAKETAHQIGTPLSSLMGWSNILKEKDLDHQIIHEIDNDIMRLNKITKRFSEIGSKTKLKVENLNEILNTILVYLEKRNSSLIKFEFYPSNDDIKIKINKTLIEWVIENIVKNAIDSMSGNGKVQIKIIKENNQAKILISDNGSGMSNSQKNKIFDEGFTSKENGWGLGLSFSKRIMTVYHEGNIKVKNSTLGKGTTFELTFPIN
tara:strand:+ start:234 stop:1349 length:1116 start_codon:yes stop_codon:yes gene_type:complete